MKKIINLLTIIPLLTVAIILFDGCQRTPENVIVGTWQICGMDTGTEDPICADGQGDKITFQSNGTIKDKNGLLVYQQVKLKLIYGIKDKNSKR